MNIVLGLLAFGLVYLLVGAAVAGLYVSPWLKTLSPQSLRGILNGVDGLELDTPRDLEIARHAYVVSIIPVWPVYAYRVATYGRHLS
jgi:hypothetical protein